MTMDMLPTYAELAGVAAPDDVDGSSLLALLLENSPLPERDVFWRMRENWAVRRGPWKVVGRGERQRLFNLDDDIGESNDVCAKHPELLAELLASFRAWEQDVDGT